MGRSPSRRSLQGEKSLTHTCPKEDDTCAAGREGSRVECERGRGHGGVFRSARPLWARQSPQAHPTLSLQRNTQQGNPQTPGPGTP